MTKITTQTIPSALITNYRRFLQRATGVFEIDYAKKREALREPPKQTYKASAAQLAVRRTFVECTKCFEQQPEFGGATPPDVGPRNRSWWFDTAAAINPFIPHGRRILSWAGDAQAGQKRPGSDFVYRLTHEYLKINEQDFIDFYNDMKPLYGYPWSPTNDPDEIAFKMWRIIAGEIEYNGETYVYMALTPGETSKLGTGDCEDMSILFFALLWKALLDSGKDLAWVNAHASLVYLDLGEVHHAYVWWKDENDDTRIVECTSRTTDLPADIYGAPLWSAIDPTWQFTRVNQVGEYNPWTLNPPGESGQFYYNYFMQQTLNALFADTTPDWCRPIAEQDAWPRSPYPDDPGATYPTYSVRDYPGVIYYILIQFDTWLMPIAVTRYLNLWCLTVTWWGGTQFKTFYVDIYKIAEPWKDSTASWNNKPALGAKIGTWSKAFDFGAPGTKVINPYVYHKLTLPNAGDLKNGICLVGHHESSQWSVRWASKEYFAVIKRPHITRD